MTIALIRHAARERYADNIAEEHLPLTDEGRTQASALAAKMAARGIRPEIYLTSRYVHAQQTGGILRDLIASAAALVQLRTLTPHEEYDFQGILTEAHDSGHDVGGLSTIALVLHHPRVNQLLEKLTSRTISTKPQYSEAVCVAAPSLADFVEGRAQEQCRLSGDS